MRIARLVLALAVTAVPAGGAAQVINFDDIPDAPGNVYVPETYMGYTFGGGYGSGVEQCGFPGQCSWVTNRGSWADDFPLNVSGLVSAWANGATALTIGRATPFTFTSAYLGSRFGSCPTTVPTATITGSLAGTTVFTTDRALTCGGFQLELFNWANVDLIQIATPSPIANVTVDDITLVGGAVATIPEPATVVLVGAGLLTVGAMARRRRTVH